VTDAGYRNPWFREVEKHGWFWLGRVRGDVGFKRDGQALWRSNKSFYPSANARAKYLGCGELGRKSPLHAHLHLYKAKAKHREDKRSSKAGRNHTAQQSYIAGSKEPWLLATNLPEHVKFNSKQLVTLYARRMQIEETFRDIKSPQYGMGLRHSNSRCIKRFDILLLIAMLAEWLLRLLGLIAQQQHWERAFQANTTRHRRVLSIIRLGREVRKRASDYKINTTQITWAAFHLKSINILPRFTKKGGLFYEWIPQRVNIITRSNIPNRQYLSSKPFIEKPYYQPKNNDLS